MDRPPVPECLPFDHPYKFLIHDRDSIFSGNVDQAIRDCGIHVLKTPVRSPTANAFCECLAYVIPLNERHARKTAAEFADHYNRAGRILRAGARHSGTDSSHRSGQSSST